MVLFGMTINTYTDGATPPKKRFPTSMAFYSQYCCSAIAKSSVAYTTSEEKYDDSRSFPKNISPLQSPPPSKNLTLPLFLTTPRSRDKLPPENSHNSLTVPHLNSLPVPFSESYPPPTPIVAPQSNPSWMMAFSPINCHRISGK
jgi:hypothetical protein